MIGQIVTEVYGPIDTKYEVIRKFAPLAAPERVICECVTIRGPITVKYFSEAELKNPYDVGSESRTAASR
jgi:hypothetical protein